MIEDSKNKESIYLLSSSVDSGSFGFSCRRLLGVASFATVHVHFCAKIYSYPIGNEWRG
jgi:hypothetical protein